MQKFTLILSFVAFAFTNTIYSNPINPKTEKQPTKVPMEIHMGIGRALLGSGDVITTQMETELNLKLNKYITLGENVTFGKGGWYDYRFTNYIQINSNVFVSPFKNTGKGDFRLGTGLSYSNVTDVQIIEEQIISNNIKYKRSIVDNRHTMGVNITIDYNHAVNNRVIIGGRLINQQYLNGDINTGIYLKCGIKL